MAISNKVTVGRSLLSPSNVSIMALATAIALVPQSAQAESFQATPTVTAGAATIAEGATTTDVSIESTQVVIDWVPDDIGVGGGNIIFQAAGTSASFVNNPNVFIGDYAVLNRIVPADPSRMVELNGSISSLIDDGSISSLGGNIFFYSPGGILVGGTAVINAGSLVLTANDPLVIDGQFIDGNNTVLFQQASQAGATVMTATGSNIFTSGNPDFSTPGYLALVAPVVQHAGNSFSNTAAAMVSADAATITFSPDGLFDIQVTSGTSGVGTTLSVSGNLNTELGGYAYLAAVPKNDAITMAITAGAEVGFDVAQNATAVNASTVILGAGTDIPPGGISLSRSGGSGTGTVNVDIDAANIAGFTRIAGTGSLSIGGGANIRGTFDGQVNGAINILADTDDIIFASSLSLDTGQFSGEAVDNSPDIAADITVIASNGNSLSINGPTTLRTIGGSGQLTVFGATGKDGTGGDIIFSADGGSIAVNGALQLLSQGVGRQAGVGGTSGTGTAGDISVIANNGSISAITMNLLSLGGAQSSSNGGDGFGGTIIVDALGGGSVSSGNYTAIAQGTGGEATAVGGMGGDGFGGTIQFRAFDGTISETSAINSSSIRAQGFGGDAFEDNGIGGNGEGGVVNITASGTSAAISFQNLASGVFASGFGGANGDVEIPFGANATGGAGEGGFIAVSVFNGANFNVGGTGNTFFQAAGIGGASEGLNGQGGSAIGGGVDFIVQDGAVADLGSTGNLDTLISTNAFGGNGGVDGVGGDAISGLSRLFVSDADLQFGNLNVSAIAQSGSGGDSGTAIGFGAIVIVDETGQGASLTGNILTVISDAIVPDSLGAGEGGSAIGGTSQLQITGANASVQVNLLDIDAEATGGTSLGGGTGGDADGGAASLLVDGGQLVVAGMLELSTSAQGGSGAEKPGGSGGGLGGTTTLSIVNGGSASAFSYDVLAEGGGGNLTADNSNQFAGEGFGGTVDVDIIDSTMLNTSGGDGSQNNFSATGIGGDVTVSTPIGTGMSGGTGDGGSVQFTVAGPDAQVNLSEIYLVADGFGGSLFDFVDQGVGGNGIGGGVILTIADGAQLSIDVGGTSEVAAIGSGGTALGALSTGGDGIGGGATIDINGGTLSFAAGSFLQALSDGTGGIGELIGGDGDAGISQVNVFANQAGLPASFNIDTLLISSSAGGGSALNGGNATGGTATITAGGNDGLATIDVTDLDVLAQAFGGGGTVGQGGVGGNGGSAQGGFADLSAIAGNGQVTVANALVDVSGTGGNGGDGGSNPSGAGFDGGLGGDGFGGIARVGTFDFANSPGTAGFIDLGVLFIAADGVGGLGGPSGTGTTVSGNGGDGGNGDSGGARLTAEGAPINISQFSILTASGIGGDGGFSASGTLGVGGDGFIGGDNSLFIAVDDARIVTRVGSSNGVAGSINLSAQGTINILANAAGGTGSVNGTGTKLGRAYFIDNGGMITGGSIGLTALYDTEDPAAEEEALYFRSGSTTTLEVLSVNTPGALSYANEGMVTLASLVLDAPDYVFSTVATPTTLGTTSFDNLTYSAAANIILQSNFVSNLATPVSFATPGDVFVGDVSTPNSIFIQSGGGLTAGQVDSGGLINIQSVGNVSFTGASAVGSLAIVSAGDVLVSNSLSAGTDVNVNAGGSLTIAGSVTSGSTPFNDLVNLRAETGDISVGSVLAGQVIVVGSGAITIGNLTSTGGFSVLSTLGSGGTVTVAGDWSGLEPTAGNSIVSNDLVIQAGGSISVDPDQGLLIITSQNPDGLFLGSAADSSPVGMGINQAEFDSISGGALYFLSQGEGSNGSFVEIGDLSVTYSSPTSFIGIAPSSQMEGLNTLFVSGDIITTNAGPGTELAFGANNLLVDAATGGIFSLDSLGDPNGFVSIFADRFLIAEQSVLDQLVADPMLANRADLINTPTLVTRPDGVFVAGGVGLFGTTQVAIQNTGTAQLPAGFFVVDGFSEFDTPGVEFLINGQLGDGQGGVVTGDAVAEIVFTDPDIPLLEGSTVNGCVAVGDCPVIVAGPVEIAVEIALTPENELTTITNPQLPDSDGFGDNPDLGDDDGLIDTGLETGGFDPSEDVGIGDGISGTGAGGEGSGEGTAPSESSQAEQEEQEEEQAAEAPIEAPATVIDTSQIDPNNDIFAPVSGGANPSLVGSAKPADDEAGEVQ